MSVAEQMIEAQDRVIDQVESTQSRLIEMNQRMAEALTGVMPGDRLPTFPGAGNMPKPQELIERYFDFTAKMAEANRTFYTEMANIWVADQPESEDA